ncbi:MAG TPA: cache domain-containing protein, partial [Albitalea sp.]|nr:cache domain-containing protein [Albitalea sp.]
MIRRRPFVGKLLALAGAAMLPLLLLFGYAAWRASDEAQRGATGAVRMRASLLAQQTAATLGRAENLLGFLARRPELIALDAPQCGALLASMAAVDPQWSNVAVTTPSGELVCATVNVPTQPHTSVASEPWFAPAMAADGFLVSQPTVGRVSGRPAVVLSLPLRTLDGRPIGLIGVSLDLARFTAEWEQSALPPGSLLALHNGTGTLVVRVPPADAAAQPGIEAELAAFQRDRPDGAGLSIGADGVERVMAVTGVPGRRWVAVAGIPSAQVYAPGRAALSRSLLGVTLAALLAGALALVIARRLAAPLNALARTARAVAEGERSARADERCPGEFRDVAVEFNRMLDARDQAESEGRESQRRLQEMLDHA